MPAILPANPVRTTAGCEVVSRLPCKTLISSLPAGLAIARPRPSKAVNETVRIVPSPHAHNRHVVFICTLSFLSPDLIATASSPSRLATTIWAAPLPPTRPRLTPGTPVRGPALSCEVLDGVSIRPMHDCPKRVRYIDIVRAAQQALGAIVASRYKAPCGRRRPLPLMTRFALAVMSRRGICA